MWRFLIVTVLFLHLLTAYNVVPGFDTGFAKSKDLRNFEKALARVRENQLLEAVEKERRNVCVQLAEGNKAAVAYAAKRRDDLLREYENLTNTNPPHVSCSELGVS